MTRHIPSSTSVSISSLLQYKFALDMLTGKKKKKKPLNYLKNFLKKMNSLPNCHLFYIIKNLKDLDFVINPLN